MLEDATLEYQDTSKHATNALLLALISFAQRIGCLDLLQQVEVPMKEVVHTVHEKIVTLLLSYASGCPSSHALEQQLRPQQLAAQALAISAFADHSSFSRFYDRIDPSALEELRLVVQQLHAQHGLAHHLEGIVVVDFDSTGLVVCGDQFELAREGYFPHARGACGYQLSLAVASNAGSEVLAHILDAGHVNGGSRAYDLLYAVGESLGFLDARLLVRGDRAYGVGAFIAHLLELNVGFVLKGRDRRTAQRWVAEVGSTLCWVPVTPTCAVADIGPQLLPDCHTPVRTILIRIWEARTQQYSYSYLVTTLPWAECSEADVYHFYNERVTLEKLIERTKNVWHLIHRPTHEFWGLKFYFELRFLAYHLVLWYQHYVLGEEQLLQEMSVFALVTRVGPQAVVAEQQPQRLVLYLATAPLLVQQLLAQTQAWLRQLAAEPTIKLGMLRRLQFDWQCLVDAVWQAGRRLGGQYQSLSCKT